MMRAILHPCLCGHAADDLLGVKILAGNLASGSAVSRVIALDGVQSGEDIVHRGETKQAVPRGNELAEARLLGDHRLRPRQIADAAVAAPAAVEARVLILGNGELAPRAADVVSVGKDVQ